MTAPSPHRPPTTGSAIDAARRRRRIPAWAIPVMIALPLWAVIYVASVQPPPADESDPLVIGRIVYEANCAQCHLASGHGVASGGTGQQLADRNATDTFADPLSMAYWIRRGAQRGARSDGTYGDLDRRGGVRTVDLVGTEMPGFDQLTDEELAAVVLYIRHDLAGGEVDDDPTFNPDEWKKDRAALAAVVASLDDVDDHSPDDILGVDGAEPRNSRQGP